MMKKFIVIFIALVLSVVVSGTIVWGMGLFIFSDKSFLNILSIGLWIIAFGVFFKLVKDIVLKEGELSAKNAKMVICIILIITVILGVFCICKMNRVFINDYDKFVEDIQMTNRLCPIKGEDGELTSIELHDGALVLTYLFYEYREQTVELLCKNEQVV
ncbi:hypothetical protein [uncultured Bacteroides sp.]|uniref:hypothetical protein n=1 Tax=uncultured Bacteroides sp. TaxID=162156 RepID=UPI00262ABBEE|nr:hypothetical protein [uncultured Bacteroides sp.]